MSALLTQPAGCTAASFRSRVWVAPLAASVTVTFILKDRSVIDGQLRVRLAASCPSAQQVHVSCYNSKFDAAVVPKLHLSSLIQVWGLFWFHASCARKCKCIGSLYLTLFLCGSGARQHLEHAISYKTGTRHRLLNCVFARKLIFHRNCQCSLVMSAVFTQFCHCISILHKSTTSFDTTF